VRAHWRGAKAAVSVMIVFLVAKDSNGPVLAYPLGISSVVRPRWKRAFKSPLPVSFLLSVPSTFSQIRRLIIFPCLSFPIASQNFGILFVIKQVDIFSKTGFESIADSPSLTDFDSNSEVLGLHSFRLAIHEAPDDYIRSSVSALSALLFLD
jgi:hypothetical protein